MPDIDVTCPKCGAQMTADESLAGSVALCPKCENHVMIPMPAFKKDMEIGGFILEQQLGVGGMGEVWLAHQKAMDRKVALKILSPEFANDADFIARFTKEVKMSAKLDHQNIITAFDAGFDKGFHYLAISYVDGEELDAKLEREKMLPEKEALRIARAIAEALRYAWNNFKILHRDIKPSNIMLDSTGTPKLMDMGISKSLAEDTNLTMTGMVVGSPHYMSPEQGMAEEGLNFTADIYSLGATLYYAVTGSVPYDATTAMGILSKHLTEDFPPPRERNPKVSEQCAVLLEVMMAKKKEHRQKSWEDVIRDIDLVLEGKFPLTKRPGIGKSVVMQTPKDTQKRVKISRPKQTQKNIPPVERTQQKPEKKKSFMRKAALVLLILFVGLVATLKITKTIRDKRNNKLKEQQVITKTSPEKPEPQSKSEEKAITPRPKPEPAKIVEKKNSPPEPEKIEIPKPPVKERFTNRPGPADKPLSPKDRSRRNERKKDKILELQAELMRLNPDYRGEGHIRIMRNKIVGADLSNTDISDISPLAGLPLEELNLDNSPVKSIKALKDMPLRRLNLHGTEVKDLSPLKGMPLKDLNLDQLGIDDENLKYLKGMPLRRLGLESANITNLEPLRGMPLRKIFLGRCSKLDDLHPLLDCKELEEIIVPEHVEKINYLRQLPKLRGIYDP